MKDFGFIEGLSARLGRDAQATVLSATMHLGALQRTAMTLIEVLAVLVILSTVAAATVVRLSAAGDDAKWRTAVAEIRDLDARARLYARSGRPVVMTVADDGHALQLREPHGDGLLAQTSIFASGGSTSSVEIRTIDDSKGEPRVRFDRLGRSDSYTVRLRSSTRSADWRVCGLTGCVLPEDAP